MNVRIGNDIRLNLTLKGPRNYDQANIKQLRAYLINTSMLDFDGPFEPCMCSNSGCRINACGKGGYFHDPSNFHHCCDGCCDYKYWLRPCKPFGPCPLHHHHRGPFHPHLWWDKPVLTPGRVPFNVALVEGPLPPKYGPGCDCGCECDGHCHPWHKPCSHPHPGMGCGFCGDPAPTHINEDFRYLAPSRVLEEKNRIQVYFPACDQYACGVYKLVIVLVVYEAGWGRCDLHTYTIDYGDVLTLVDDNSGVSGDITLDIDNNTMSNSDIVGINVKASDYYIYPNTSLPYGGTDNRGNVYEIEVTLSNGATVKYTTDGDNWPYEDTLDFTSTTPSVASITDSHGTIQGKNVVGDSYAIIKISSHKNPGTYATARVNIESRGVIDIPVDRIEYTSPAVVYEGRTINLGIIISPSNHTQNVSYSVVQDGRVITDNTTAPYFTFNSDNGGSVYGVSEGRGVIYVNAGNKSEAIEVTVLKSATPVQPLSDFYFTSPLEFFIGPNAKDLPGYIGNVVPTNANYTMGFSSLDSSIAAVRGTKLYTIGVGTTTVTATSNNGISKTSTVNVLFPYTQLPDKTLEVGDSIIVEANRKSGAPQYTVTWKVVDENGNPTNVASITPGGTLSALRPGTVKVRYYVGEGTEWESYQEFTLNVINKADSTLVVNPTTIEYEWDWSEVMTDEYGGVNVTTTGPWTAEIV